MGSHGGLAVALIILAACDGSAPPDGHGSWIRVHSAPVMQSITRTAFVHPPFSGDPVVQFSTLERPPSGRGAGQFALARYEPAMRSFGTLAVDGAAEARVSAWVPALGRYVLGTSLRPSLLLYDPRTGTASTRHRFHGIDGWIHGVGVLGTVAYAMTSAPANAAPAIIGVDLRNGSRREFKVPAGRTGWGGVQTVDPTGRVWWFQGHAPRTLFWFRPGAGSMGRRLVGLEGWSPTSWDVWHGDFYITVTRSPDQVGKVRVDPETFEVLPAGGPADEHSRIFLESVRVDLFHAADDSAGALYVDPRTSQFYKRSPQVDRMESLGRAALGRITIGDESHGVQEHGVRWLDGEGEVNVLGVDDQGRLITWRRGATRLGLVDLDDGSWTEAHLPSAHRSPARITSLAAGQDGLIYGAGLLTMSDLFGVEPASAGVRRFTGAIPGGEGQVDTLFVGRDGVIYGVGYPGVVPFRWNPAAGWNPGTKSASNPRNLGPIADGTQMRVKAAVEGPGRQVWVASTSDYGDSTVSALTRVDFETGEMASRMDADGDFPAVDSLAAADGSQLAAIGRENGRPTLYFIDANHFRITTRFVLPRPVSALHNTSPFDDQGTLLAAQGASVVSILKDGQIDVLATCPDDIVKMTAGPSGTVLLLGRSFVAQFDPDQRALRSWWRSGWFDDQVFPDSEWMPAAYAQGSLFVGRAEELWRLSPADRISRSP